MTIEEVILTIKSNWSITRQSSRASRIQAERASTNPSRRYNFEREHQDEIEVGVAVQIIRPSTQIQSPMLHLSHQTFPSTVTTIPGSTLTRNYDKFMTHCANAIRDPSELLWSSVLSRPVRFTIGPEVLFQPSHCHWRWCLQILSLKWAPMRKLTFDAA